MTNPNVFLVIEDNSIIADDLSESIKEYVRDAEVHLWTREQFSVDAVRSLKNLSAAFASMQADHVIALGLDKAVELQGGRLVVLDAPAENLSDAMKSWNFLDRPFTGYQIHSVLEAMGIAKTDPAP